MTCQETIKGNILTAIIALQHFQLVSSGNFDILVLGKSSESLRLEGLYHHFAFKIIHNHFVTDVDISSNAGGILRAALS